MSNKKVTAFGIFVTSRALDVATDALVKRGFPAADLSVGRPESPAPHATGGILLSVHCNTAVEIALAREILEGSGAVEASSTGESGIGTQRMDRVMAMAMATDRIL